MNQAPHYVMVIHWSDLDQVFLVTLPEWSGRVFGPVTHGATYDEAARNAQEALELLIESAREHGEPLPEPRPFPAASAI